jgi:predicted acyl esterase
MAVSEPTHKVQVDRDVPVPMRDGTILRADVYRPEAEGRFPVVVERTQLGRGGGGHGCPITGAFLIRVQVTSSDFPRYDRNLNTGGPFGEETHGQVAVNTVFHDAMRPSHMVMPLTSAYRPAGD